MTQSLLKQIVFATDFSAGAGQAQDHAVFLAKMYEAKLHLLHVLENPLWFGLESATAPYLKHVQEESERRLAELEQGLTDSGLKDAQVRLVIGIPSEEIKKAAQNIGADLVVVGTSGRTGLDVVLLGSTAERVIKDAPCPVLAIPARPETGPTPSIQHVMTPVDFSSPSLDAVEYAIQVANHFGAKVTLVHVLEPIYYGYEPEQSVEAKSQTWVHWRAQLGELSGLISSFGLATRAMIRGGIPANSIIDTAKEQGCDLIVMGTHGRRRWARLVFGSVAEAVLRRAPCPVLTVKRSEV